MTRLFTRKLLQGFAVLSIPICSWIIQVYICKSSKLSDRSSDAGNNKRNEVSEYKRFIHRESTKGLHGRGETVYYRCRQMWNILKNLSIVLFMRMRAFHFWIWGLRFENDVNMYGTQACNDSGNVRNVFENDVNMYGTQAEGYECISGVRLRMM